MLTPPRRRRIKCDEGHPCQSCLSSHSPCTFEEPGKRTQHSKSKSVISLLSFFLSSHFFRRTATLEDRMHHLETLIQSIPTNIFEAAARAHASSLDPHALSLGPTSYPPAVPPPSLTMSALTNPSMHFPPVSSRPMSFSAAFDRVHIPAQSYMYWDEQGCKRWQGESSGLPLLDLLFDRAVAPGATISASGSEAADSPSASEQHQQQQHHNHPLDEHPSPQPAECEWFPDRPAPRDESINPESLWRVITSMIPPDLMDT